MTKPCEVSARNFDVLSPYSPFPHFQGSDTPRVTRRARDIRIPESATANAASRGAKKPSGQ